MNETPRSFNTLRKSGNLFVAIGNAELCNSIASYFIDQEVDFIKILNYCGFFDGVEWQHHLEFSAHVALSRHYLPCC
jgi:hypothetical protein